MNSYTKYYNLKFEIVGCSVDRSVLRRLPQVRALEVDVMNVSTTVLQRLLLLTLCQLTRKCTFQLSHCGVILLLSTSPSHSLYMYQSVRCLLMRTLAAVRRSRECRLVWGRSTGRRC